MLRLSIPRGTTTIGYADDTLIVAKGDSVDALQERANVALETVTDAIQSLGLRLAVVFMKRYGVANPLVLLEGETFQLKASLKHLGIVFERERTMFGTNLAEKVMAEKGPAGYRRPRKTDAERWRTEREPEPSVWERRELCVVVQLSDIDSLRVP